MIVASLTVKMFGLIKVICYSLSPFMELSGYVLSVLVYFEQGPVQTQRWGIMEGLK